MDQPDVRSSTVADDDDALLAELGYKQQLTRAMGRFTAFCVTFSIISATTAVFTTFGYGLSTGGPAFVWTYPIAIVVLGFWILIAADMVTKLPIAGYAYQWSSRLISKGFGWFTGWVAVVGWLAGMTGVTYGCAGYLGSLVGLNVTPGTQALITVALTIVVMAINIVGVKVTTKFNNMGAVNEILFSAAGVTVVVAVVAFIAHRSPHNISFLFSRGGVTAKPYIWAWLTAGLTGLWGLLGSESAADVAEETKDTRRTIPRAMFIAFGAAAVIEFFMFAVFTLATPNLAQASSSASPIAMITQHYLGTGLTDFFLVTVIFAMVACSTVNMLVITRLVFSLARDNMLPGSKFFGKVSPRFHVPVNTIVVAGILSCLFVISAKAVGYIVGLSALAFYLVFLLMGAGLIYALRRGRVPTARGGFDLGRWRMPVYIVGTVLFLATVLMLSLTPANRINGRNMLIVVVLAAAWYVFSLRGKLRRGEAGAPSSGVTEISSQDTSAAGERSPASPAVSSPPSL